MISRGIDGEEIKRVGGEIIALLGSFILGTGLPSVRESDDMVDLDALGNSGFFGKDFVLAGVGLVVFARNNIATVKLCAVAKFALNDFLP